jgi:dethiobiotin synthetase
MSGYFITSTDTNVGKTTACLCLIKHLKESGKRVACMKPVSAGCTATTDGLRNDDAVQLIGESSIPLPYELVNPYAFEPPVAPHIAAKQSKTLIELATIKDCYDNIENKADVVVVEGAGGWLVPINETETMADVAAVLQLPVILVVGIRLGCLNHALLTANSIVERGLTLAGWIANHLDNDMREKEKNIETLEKMIAAPLIGTVDYCNNINDCNIKFNESCIF